MRHALPARFAPRLVFFWLFGLLALLSACGSPAAPGSQTPAAGVKALATGTVLRQGTGLYPRLVRLEHSGSANGRILASVVLPPANGQPGQGLIFESSNDGASFAQVGAVTDPASTSGLCCNTLYELPQQVGNLPAGTLLWSASVGQDAANRRMWLPIWKSSNQGRTWSYLSSCAQSPNTGGYWEPEFSVASDGALVCHYSDEGDPAHSQKLMHARSYDGVTWRDWSPTVSSNLQSDRPGMAVVRKLPNGTYFMTFEICTPGGQYQCVAHDKTSADGWNWGDPAGLGIRPETADGLYFRADPNQTWVAGGGPNGRLVMVGQFLMNRDGTQNAGTGRTLFVNSNLGSGPWTAIAAPVQVPNVFPDYCPNYSSALLGTAGGTRILEIATDYAGSTCQAYFASGPLPGGSSVSLPLDQYRSLQVTTPGLTNRYARHYNYLGYTEIVDAGSSATLKADATFRIVRGLADGTCYSFEARNFPNNFLRHRDSRIRLDPRDGAGLFDQDATWCARGGLSGTGVSLEAKNFPGRYLRHYNAELWLAQSGGPLVSDNAANFSQDASWNVVGAWAP